MELNIRRVKKKDLEKLAEIYNQVYNPSVFDIGERWTEKSAYEMLRYWFKREPDLAFLAEYGKKIVGAFFVGVKPWWDGNHLVDGEIFVHPDYQNQGIGKKLLKFVFEYSIKKYNITRWDTYTVKGKFALEWYKKLGFQEIKEWEMISGDVKRALKKLKYE